jgi:hypothetical protein
MNAKNICYVDRRNALLVMFGEVCRTCGGIDELEFCHIMRTDCHGEGRGYIRRVLDVEQHPESYTLLCRDCHDLLDGRVRRKRQPDIRRFLDGETMFNDTEGA